MGVGSKVRGVLMSGETKERMKYDEVASTVIKKAFLMPDRCGKLRRNTQLPKEYMSYAVSANGLQTILRSFLLCLRQRSSVS